MGSTICGYDEQFGFQLHYIDNEGVRLDGDKFAVGSGGTYAYGVLDTFWKWDLTLE